MALTDHDGVAGVPEAMATAAELGIDACRPSRCPACISTPRTSTSAATGSTSTRSSPACDRAQQERVDRARKIIERLNEHGVDVSFEDAVAKAGAADAIGRPHIAKAAGAGPDLGPFFEEYLVPGGEGVRLTRAAERRGGSAADPRRRRGRRRRPSLLGRQGSRPVPRLVESLVRDVGLDGIETFYPPHTEEQTRHCLELCEQFDLFPPASDFHGPTDKTFSKWAAYHTYGLGEPQVPRNPSRLQLAEQLRRERLRAVRERQPGKPWLGA